MYVEVMTNAGYCGKVRQCLVHELCPSISNDFDGSTEPIYGAIAHSPLMLPKLSVTEIVQHSV